ncbi:MAG TPA: hypothetical protein VGT06_05945 [Candidatus Methylomirabilis sp.]|nr:hypothetical protein [Candidatus Methylomirabilis sp.]
MQIQWKRAILAGLAGTLVFDLIGLPITRQWWDVPGLLGMKLETGLPGGVVAHYANGAILAIIYAGVGPSLWGPSWVRALTYITVQTVFGVWLFMMPLLGAGMAGLKMGALAPAIALIRHWGYGLTLAWLYPLPQVISPGQAAR